jgi:hypothetical protein
MEMRGALSICESPGFGHRSETFPARALSSGFASEPSEQVLIAPRRSAKGQELCGLELAPDKATHRTSLERTQLTLEHTFPSGIEPGGAFHTDALYRGESHSINPTEFHIKSGGSEGTKQPLAPKVVDLDESIPIRSSEMRKATPATVAAVVMAVVVSMPLPTRADTNAAIGSFPSDATSEPTGSAPVLSNGSALPDHVHLVHDSPGDSSDPCHTGNSIRVTMGGARVELLACTFAVPEGSEIPTTTAVPGGGRLLWVVAPAFGEIEIVDSLPEETGPDGRAVATLELSSNESTHAEIAVHLLDDDDVLVSSAAVQMTGLVEPQPLRSRIRLRYRAAKSIFTGRVHSSPAFCKNERKVVVKLVRPRRDVIVARDRTGRGGRFKLAYRDEPGRYYAVAKPKGSGFKLCLRAVSKRVLIRR